MVSHEETAWQKVSTTNSADIASACRAPDTARVQTWSLFVTAGVLLARYYRHWENWMAIHVALMRLAALGTVGMAAVAATLAFEGLMGAHQIVGSAVGLGVVVQAATGNWVHAVPPEERSTGRLRTAAFHRAWGKLLLPLAATAILLGMRLLAPTMLGLQAFFLCYCALLGAVFAAHEVRHQRRRRELEASTVEPFHDASQKEGGAERTVTMAELAEHRSASEETAEGGAVWLGIGGQVYDVQGFLDRHPGGRAILLSNAGEDATSKFLKVHADGLKTIERFLPPVVLVGRLAQEQEEGAAGGGEAVEPRGRAAGYAAGGVVGGAAGAGAVALGAQAAGAAAAW